MKSTVKIFSAKAVTSAVCFVIGVTAAAVLILTNISVFRRGFFCDDDSIKYPYHSDTVTVAMLVAVSLGTSILAIVLHGLLTYWHRRRQAPQDSDTKLCWKSVLFCTVVEVVCMVYAFTLVGVWTEVFKVTAGRLRPHFLDVCQLQAGSYNCSQSYVTKYTCTQTDEGLMLDARKSFISGHASTAWFHAAFFILYVQRVMCPRRWPLLRPLLQVLVGIWASYVCVSRVQDNMHHPTDVLAGSLLGAVIGAVTAVQTVYIASFLHKSKHNEMCLNEVRTA